MDIFLAIQKYLMRNIYYYYYFYALHPFFRTWVIMALLYFLSFVPLSNIYLFFLGGGVYYCYCLIIFLKLFTYKILHKPYHSRKLYISSKKNCIIENYEVKQSRILPYFKPSILATEEKEEHKRLLGVRLRDFFKKQKITSFLYKLMVIVASLYTVSGWGLY